MRRAGVEDTDAIAAICNHPRVRSRLSDPYTKIDPTRWLEDPRNIILFDGDNCALFLWRWIGIYEGHILFTARGREAFDLAAQMLDAMRGAMILAVIWKELRHAALFVRKLGFAFKGEIVTAEGPSELYQLELR